MTGQPSLWDQTGGKVGHDHPQTSHTAARQVKSGSQQALILLALWDGPATAYRLSTGGRVVNKGGYPVAPNQIATRLGELRDRGWVIYLRTFEGGPVVEEPAGYATPDEAPSRTADPHRSTPACRSVAPPPHACRGSSVLPGSDRRLRRGSRRSHRRTTSLSTLGVST